MLHGGRCAAALERLLQHAAAENNLLIIMQIKLMHFTCMSLLLMQVKQHGDFHCTSHNDYCESIMINQ